MRHFTLRNRWTRSLAVLLLCPLLLAACNDYDDSELWKNVNDLGDRIAALEQTVSRMNGEIVALQKIADESVTIVRVETTADGYVIHFSDNTTAAITNGKDGADGKPGSDGKPGGNGADAPVIGVRQDTDGVYYWTITTDGNTDWLLADGHKLRVTGESVTPVLGVDSEGYWTVSYDGGTTSARILDAAGNPVSALSGSGSGESLFKSITQDEHNVYFELTDGSVVTVPLRSDFYLLLRKAPEISTFTFGQTQTYEAEEVGVKKVILTKPDEWRVTYADRKLTITAPTEAHKDCAELQGTVTVAYIGFNGLTDAVSMDVLVEPDFTGTTVGDEFTVDITEITDKSVTAHIAPGDKAAYWYATAYDRAKYDAGGPAAFVREQLAMFDYFVQNGMEYMLDYQAHKGDFTFSATQLKPGSELYMTVFSFEVAESGGQKVCRATSEVMTVPFKTKQPVVINSIYRIAVSDITWNGARYVCVPSDDLGYFHGFAKKSDYDSYADDAAFMQSRINVYRDAFYDELYIDRILTWADLTYTGTQTVTVPKYDAMAQASSMPLVEDTEYYVYAFGCTDGDASSPLSKTAFKTGKFNPKENCTFEVTTVVDRQNVTVTVVPSDPSVTYVCNVEQRSYYQDFENDLQYAVDDLIWTNVAAQQKGVALSSLLWKGSDEGMWRDLWAATGHIVCVYGCTADGTITTRPTIREFVTKGTVDGASVRLEAHGKRLKR